MYEEVYPAVVQLKTDKRTGSGFFINDRGELITAAHVVLDARETIAVTINGKNYHAKIVDLSDTTDLARLQLQDFDGRKQPYLQLAEDSKLAADQAVYAIGYPRGFRPAYMSPGDYNAHVTVYDLVDKNKVAAKFKTATKAEKENWLKALSGKVIEGDVHIEPGNSGGPLLNSEGKVIGVADIASRDGVTVSYYRPIEDVRRFLKEDGREKTFTITYTRVAPVPPGAVAADKPAPPSAESPAEPTPVVEGIQRKNGDPTPPFDWRIIDFRPGGGKGFNYSKP
jgi:S1-C subfamily serine protease